MACQVICHARRWILGFGRNNKWYPVWVGVHLKSPDDRFALFSAGAWLHQRGGGGEVRLSAPEWPDGDVKERGWWASTRPLSRDYIDACLSESKSSLDYVVG